MKNNILIILLITVFSCNSSISSNKNSSETELDYVDIIGFFDRKELTKDPHKTWFNKNYKEYKFDKKTIDKLKPLFKDVEIKIFIGTWCSDSRKELPVFFKLMDKLKINNNKIEMI